MDNELECLRRLAKKAREVINEDVKGLTDLHPLAKALVEWEQNYDQKD